MATEPYIIKTKCSTCGGDGISEHGGGTIPCVDCGGTGELQFGIVGGAEEITALSAKLDAIKEMLDSTVCGLQKMSSNLDDIMVKLDV